MKKGLQIFFTLVTICFIGGCLYFVGGVSATFPPIRQYYYKGNPSEFCQALQHLSPKDSSLVIYVIKDTSKIDLLNAGDLVSKDCREIELVLNKKTLEETKYELVFDQREKSLTNIELVSAFDSKNNGGYGLKAVGMDRMLKKFDDKVLYPLHRQKVPLKINDSF